MKAELIKYKHYLILLAALLILSYVTIPLWELQKEQRGELDLLERKMMKTEQLLSKSDLYSQMLADSKAKEQAIEPYLFIESTESQFKLVVQQQLEKVITGADCTVQRISWKGSSVINQDLNSWELSARFKGNPACMIKVTRALDSTIPLIRVKDFSISARRIDGQVGNRVSAAFELFALHYVKASELNTSTEEE
ncbi:hypothetical protein KO495_01230 [Colwellia sp. D2M02]|uniref:hypothetical protein n=1 Tax=Colwellia sp. D2M02 TaxID=2841562 RepID=UPI001C085734|nr:hypothetical protein [Colwellia sp. D2M02]MBU2891941.1 hypothetical protein [Colwellia sp. D2M02]